MTELDFTTSNITCPDRLHQMISQDVEEAVLTLGISTVPPIGITISVPVKHRFQKKQWQQLGPCRQYHWLMREYLPRVIIPYVQRGVGVCEFTKRGNVHIHIIAWDEGITREVDMLELRATVNNCVLANSISRGKHENAKILNHVHFLQEPKEWVAYMLKYQIQLTNRRAFYPFIWNDWCADRPLTEVSHLLVGEVSANEQEPADQNPLDHERLVLPSIDWSIH